MSRTDVRLICIAFATGVFLACTSWLSAQSGAPKSGAAKKGVAAGKAATPSPVNCSSNVSVPFGAAVPGDEVLLSQPDSDCFGWAEFIALNWPTSGSSFGNPGDLSAVQWETYMQQETLYPANGAAPPPWGSNAGAIPAGCQVNAGLRSQAGRDVRILQSASKLVGGNGETFNLSQVQQAAPQGAPAWLGAQNGTNVWYEVLLNQDIYNFVTASSNQFYNATKQDSFVNNGMGSPIVFPKGALSSSPVGAIELKAAWMEVPNYNPSSPGKWAKYKLSAAVVVGPSNNQCRTVTVALVGLHIIHKTVGQPTWLWTTFEHVDNVPGPNQTKDCCNFNSSMCQRRQVTVPNASCLAKGQTSPVTMSCTANTSPPYYLGPGCPGPVPIQLTRTVALDSNAITTNKTMWSAIAGSYPSSVFQYYQLVDALWSTNATQDPTTPQMVPLNPGSSLTSGNPNVFNVTMESYAQNTKCTDCHKFATIAPQSANLPWDSDFSFAFGSASPAPSGAVGARAAKAAPKRF